MKYLAISKETDSLAYAIFDERVLKFYDKIFFKEFEEHKRVKEWYDFVSNLIRDNKIGVLTTHWVDLKKVKKKNLEKIIQVKTILQLSAIENKCIYLEAKSDGWEKYITQGRATNYKKVKIINEGYGLDLKINYLNRHKGLQDVADAIILGEAVAHGRLHI